MAEYDPKKMTLKIGDHEITGFNDGSQIKFEGHNPHMDMLQMKLAIRGNEPVNFYICSCDDCLKNLELTKKQQRELGDL